MTITTSPATLTNIEDLTLPNGVRLVYQHIPSAPRVAMACYIAGGNLMDPVPGAIDIIDRLLMKGTKTRSQEDIAVAIDGLSLEMDVDSRRDYSVLGATLLPEDLDASFELIHDIFYNATLSEFEREKVKIAGELHMELDSPKSRASDGLFKTVYANTPYGLTSSVFLETLAQHSSMDAAMAQYHAIYQPSRMIWSVAGPIDKDAVVSALTRWLPAKSQIAAPNTHDTWVKTLNAYQLAQDIMVPLPKDDGNQAHIYQGWIAPPVASDDYYPLAVMNTLLGAAGLTARLFLELRDKQGLAYNVRSSYDAYCHSGLFYLYIGTEPKNRQKCLDGFRDECDKLVTVPVSDKELAETKRNMLGRRAMALETAGQKAGYIGSVVASGRPIEHVARFRERIEAVTANDIQRVASNLFSKPSVIAIAGPSHCFE